MTRPLIVVRPEPGATATLARIADAGGRGIAVPLFAARATAWTPPDAARFDALLLTSAQAPRLAGDGLAALARLPAYAVGAATARAASGAGLDVVAVGHGGLGAICARMASHDVARALWLAGAHRTPLPPAAPVAATVAVYDSVAMPPPPDLPALIAGAVVLLHSPRAARRLADLVPAAARGRVEIAAIGADVAAASGDGWAGVTIASRPDDAALVVAAIDRARRGADKHAR